MLGKVSVGSYKRWYDAVLLPSSQCDSDTWTFPSTQESGAVKKKVFGCVGLNSALPHLDGTGKSLTSQALHLQNRSYKVLCWIALCHLNTCYSLSRDGNLN